MEDLDKKIRIVYLSHGGGPLPLMGDPGHAGMVSFMQELPNLITRPNAIIVISAHWEEPQATLFSASDVSLFYDYYGFPKDTYTIKYPASGHPDLLKRMQDLLEQNGISSVIHPDRGFDHGVFIPLKISYPDADIPCVQLSLLRGLDPTAHINLGKALRDLRDENILVIGSGFSYHNIRAFLDPQSNAINDKFQDWLIETCTGDMPHFERENRLINWESTPGARECHPREEHLLPLHVCVGLAKTPAQLVFDDTIIGKRAVAFKWN